MYYKIEKGQILYSICALLLLSGAAYGAAVSEIEPNDDMDHATPINAGDVVSGVVQYDIKDFFKLTLPQSGIVTAKLSGYSDCKFSVTIAEFGNGWNTGSVTGENGMPVSISFSAPKNTPGYIRITLDPVSGITGGNDGKYWRIIQCNKDGPYYTIPGPADEPAMTITSYEGKPVYPPLPYKLDVSFQALPDQYEPNYVEGSTKEDMLAKGIIKTIPIGSEVSAYLFNELSLAMRGTPGYDSSASFGGENDVDVYHVILSQPDTINVRLSNFPTNANSKIRITQSDGNWEDSKTDATEFSMKVTKPGNVFIEISKSYSVTGNLVYSTNPYKLLVTTGGPTPTVTPTITQTVTAMVTPTTTQTVTATVTPTITQTVTATVTPTITQTVTATVKPSGNDLITNGALQSLDGWTIHDWYKPSDGKGEVSVESDGIRFLGTSGNNHIGIMQTLNADVSGCLALNLKAVIKADEQNLAGTGWNGRESPIAVFARYTDMNNVVHNSLGEDPNEPNRMLWTGLYFIEPTGSGKTDHGIKTQKGEWYTYEFDMMKLSPKPRSIEMIGAEGAGWPTRDGKIRSLSLTCTGPGATRTATVTGTYPKQTVTVSPDGKADFTVDISPAEITVQPGENMRFTMNIVPTGGFNEPVEIYVKANAIGIEKDFGLVKTIYPPYQPYMFEKPVPDTVPKGATIKGYVTAKGGGLVRDAGTITVNVPGFEMFLAIGAFGIAMLWRKRK